jgi:hypothetical protein
MNGARQSHTKNVFFPYEEYTLPPAIQDDIKAASHRDRFKEINV